MSEGISYLQIAEMAKRTGRVTVNQYDQHPRAIQFRRAIYRAVKHGLIQRVKSKPSNATYIPKEPTT